MRRLCKPRSLLGNARNVRARKNIRTVFFYLEVWSSVDSSVREAVKRGLGSGSRRIHIVVAVTRKRLVTD
jgi:hypothetical protein